MLPDDPTGFRRALEDYPYFEPAAFTDADRDRGRQYRARARAIELKTTAGSLEEYQASLDMQALFGAIDAVNAARVTQLINKTNQFNLTTRRRNRTELEAFLGRPETRGFWVRLNDRFADHGLVAVALTRICGPRLEIDTLLMSCRVLGRGVETLILSELARIAAEAGCTEVAGAYVPTGRNGMVSDLYERHGFASAGLGEESATLWSAAPGALTFPAVPIRHSWSRGV